MKSTLFALSLALATATPAAAQTFQLSPNGYFRNQGVDVMAFDDIYPEGHQGGLCIIMHGHRVATNGDLRLEPTPGQWQPVPRQLDRKVENGAITATLCYPDSTRHETGFNPMIYPELQLQYSVRVEGNGDKIDVFVDLDSPIPDYLVGKAGFNLELFPGSLFGKPWIMDDKAGIYPQQPNSPVIRQSPNIEHTGHYHVEGKPMYNAEQFVGHGGYSPIVADDLVAEPYAVGRKFTSRPDDPLCRLTIESLNGELKLYDGRMNHNNGWYVVRQEIKAGATKGAVHWVVTPNVVEDWTYAPVVQTSQVGYHPAQQKVAIIETMNTPPAPRTGGEVTLVRIDADGEKVVKVMNGESWGHFLRYDYLKADFSDVTAPGLYQVRYGEAASPVFRIDADVYDRGVWQPVVEYFLPVQMCHMRVAEKYRVWHNYCHMDDALMAKPGNHFDGYVQDADVIPAHLHSGDKVEGVNVGGWHDAGDFDLRVESQAGECYILSLAYEAFKPEIDATSIDQQNHVTEIHQPDGKNDVLQQIEHGALSVVAGYKALGRLYRGIICNDLRQYVLLGDASAMTDGQRGNKDDRWIYTENNPGRELTTAANLAATSRVLRDYNRALSDDCLDIARKVYRDAQVNEKTVQQKLQAAAELYLTTGEQEYLDYILADECSISGAEKSIFSEGMAFSATNLSVLSRVEPLLRNSKDKRVKRWLKAYRTALEAYSEKLASDVAETPYGVPYRPHIWGAGWDIQRFGYENYFLAAAYPDLFTKEPIFNALNFILGCHPGSNQASFASGVGAQSATVGYGLNRADWSYIPGGVISGTALIRPDYPELLTFPFLWQQTEYVLGGGSSHYMFLVLAAQHFLEQK